MEQAEPWSYPDFHLRVKLVCFFLRKHLEGSFSFLLLPVEEGVHCKFIPSLSTNHGSMVISGVGCLIQCWMYCCLWILTLYSGFAVHKGYCNCCRHTWICSNWDSWKSYPYGYTYEYSAAICLSRASGGPIQPVQRHAMLQLHCPLHQSLLILGKVSYLKSCIRTRESYCGCS